MNGDALDCEFRGISTTTRRFSWRPPECKPAKAHRAGRHRSGAMRMSIAAPKWDVAFRSLAQRQRAGRGHQSAIASVVVAAVEFASVTCRASLAFALALLRARCSERHAGCSKIETRSKIETQRAPRMIGALSCVDLISDLSDLHGSDRYGLVRKDKLFDAGDRDALARVVGEGDRGFGAVRRVDRVVRILAGELDSVA